jgi:protein tyrosine phosphatase (PTP) superfamily phosphohydrolase (DUF442 family)
VSRRWWLAAAAGLAVLAALLLAARARYHGPVRVVEAAPGLLVAGQPEAEEWREVVEQRGVRAVVNLRGSRPSERWYADEVAACRELGVQRADVRIKLDDWPPQHEVRRFVALLDALPRPLLLHCKDGFDRSGWGAGVALALAGAPLDAALAWLAPAAGHLCRPDACPLHRFFAEYESWRRRVGRSHDAAAFRQWLLAAYCPPPYDAGIALGGEAPARVRPGEGMVLPVRVVNRSQQPWRLSSDRQRGIRLGARALGPLAAWPADPVAEFRRNDGRAHDLARAGVEDGEVAAGGERTFELRFRAPDGAGSYAVHVDMVDEHVHWFSDLGGPGVVLRLDVVRD